MRTRFVALLTTLCLLAGMIVVLPAAAEETHRIATAADLMALATGDLSGNYIQTADIDLGRVPFTPIGSLEHPFTGNYNGNGFRISGLYVAGDGKDYQGLFGFNCGTVRNVTLTADCIVEGRSNVGAIAGRNSGTVEDCISDASVGHSPLEQQAPVYTLLSQNLCQWGDNALASNSQYVDSTTYSRRPGMIQRIRNTDPDFMCFQEVSFADRKMSGKTITAWDTYLKNQLPDYTFVGDYRSDSDKEGVTVAFKTEKYNCIDSGMFWLSPTPDAPRSQQKPAWGASHVRACTWVLLEEKTTGNQFAVYSTHLDHTPTASLARINGAKVMNEKIEALKKKYPNAIFAVAGDYNEEPDVDGYLTTELALNGNMDDARYSADEALPDRECGTYGNDINSVTDTDGTIDFIFFDSSMAKVHTFQVLTDYYNNLRISDHHGLLSTFGPAQNSGIGGIVGVNCGTVQRIIARGAVSRNTVPSIGTVLGNNTGRADTILTTDPSNAVGTGRQGSFFALPATPNIETVALLNKQAGRSAFTLKDGDYFPVGTRPIQAPVCLTVNGTDYGVYPGTVFTAQELGIENPTFFLNGELQQTGTVLVPPQGGTLTVAPPVTEVSQWPALEHYTVRSMEDWTFLAQNKGLFAGAVIHLLCDLDFKNSAFTSISNPGFSFDGHNHTISGWGTTEAPLDQNGFFTVDDGAKGMGFIKNIRFENCHARVIGERHGTALVYGVRCSNEGLAGLPTTFTMENVHVNNCTLGADSAEATGFLLSRYGVPNEYVDVYVKNCSVLGSTLDAGKQAHKGLLVGKVRSNLQLKQARFFFEDCFVAENTILNSMGTSGFVMGSIESTSIDAYLSNVGVFNNTMKGTNDGSLICSMSQGGIVVERTVCAGNTLEQATKYIISCHATNPVNVTFKDVFTDAEGFTGVVEGKSVSHTPSKTDLASGKAVHTLNNLLKDPAFYWKKQGTTYLPASAAERLYKVSLRSDAGETVHYLNGGSVLPLEQQYLMLEGSSTITDNKLTVSSDTVLSQMSPVSSVTQAVTKGDYSVSTPAEWEYLYEHRALFRSTDVTVHLMCDVDLSAMDFAGFDDSFFSFDGHNHTLSGWGTKEKPAVSKGLFHTTKTQNNGLSFIRNLRMENCHLIDDETAGCSSLIYGVYHGNAGQEGLPAQLTLENIHVSSCTMTVLGEASGVLLSRYGPVNKNFTVNITNCSVTDTVLDAREKDHVGLLVGKVRSNNNNKSAVFRFTDCYLAGNTLKNTKTNNAGLIFGTAEINQTTAVLSNIGVVNNTMESDAAALIGYCDAGSVQAENLFFAANKVTAPKTYLLNTDRTSSAINASATNVFTDVKLTAGSVVGSLSYTVDNGMENGAFTYRYNALLKEPSFFWGMKDGLPVPVAAANRTAKVNVISELGEPFDTAYYNGGTTVDLSSYGMRATLYNTPDGKLEGSMLTLPQNGTEVTVVLSEKCTEHQFTETPFPHDATHHTRRCSFCPETTLEACRFTTITAKTALPAVGNSFEGTATCADGCGNALEPAVYTVGDATGDGSVSVADAVYILRITAGYIDAKNVLAALGDLDRDTEITTADAVLLLQYFIS